MHQCPVVDAIVSKGSRAAIGIFAGNNFVIVVKNIGRAVATGVDAKGLPTGGIISAGGAAIQRIDLGDLVSGGIIRKTMPVGSLIDQGSRLTGGIVNRGDPVIQGIDFRNLLAHGIIDAGGAVAIGILSGDLLAVGIHPFQHVTCPWIWPEFARWRYGDSVCRSFFEAVVFSARVSFWGNASGRCVSRVAPTRSRVFEVA